MAQLVSELRCGEWKLLLCGECVQKAVNVIVMQEITVLVGGKKLIQIEGILNVLSVDVHATFNFPSHNVRHLVSKQVETR